jgi:dTDP-4-amino-4,6-dideoxygalactose transaminase
MSEAIMKVPFLDLKAQYNTIKYEVNAAIQEIINNTAFILGDSVKAFQKEFAKAHEVKFCYGTSSGTAGNHLVLWSLGIEPGDEVIIPANTFVATAWGATLCGANPVFVDCEKDSYNLDPVKVEEAINPRTKAIVAVHLYGQPANMGELRRIAKRYNVHLVEDAAQAHLAEYAGARVGSLAEAASFSFYPGKNLGAYGEAGAVVTNDSSLAERIKLIREHGQPQKYYHDVYGHNYRMEGIQGAVLNVKMKYLDYWTNRRREVAERYNELLRKVDEIILPVEMSYAKHVYHLFVIQVRSNSGERRKLAEYLNDAGISTGMHYPVPLHLQKCFSHLGYEEGDFPLTEQLAEHCLSLPMFPELTKQQVDYVCLKIKDFYSKKTFVKETHSEKISNMILNHDSKK